jgi:hypothetical protein
MPKLFVSQLKPHQMVEAYPLIRRLARVDSSRWEAFGRLLAKQGGGILAVRAEDQRVHGVATYLPVASLKHGSALRVEAIASFELGQISSVRNALSSALDELAREKRCKVVVICLDAATFARPRFRRWQSWGRLGLTVDTVGLIRHVEECAAAGICAR